MSELLARSRYSELAVFSAKLRREAELSTIAGRNNEEVIIELETAINILKDKLPEESSVDSDFRDAVTRLVTDDIEAIDKLRESHCHDRDLKRMGNTKSS